MQHCDVWWRREQWLEFSDGKLPEWYMNGAVKSGAAINGKFHNGT